MRGDHWQAQMRERIRSVDSLLARFPSIGESVAVRELEAVVAAYPLAVTPYYAGLVREPARSDPLGRMCIPDTAELAPCGAAADPFDEDGHSPVPRLVRRYADRALVIATSECAAYCRHCTRKRLAGKLAAPLDGEALRRVAAYLAAEPRIEEVLVSGGDPLVLPTAALAKILAAVRSVPHIGVIRIGTRVPVVLPQRVDAELTGMLAGVHPLWVNTHFNHPRELTPQAARACAALVDAGIPLGNQAVLLRGVNDTPRIQERLHRGLVRLRVRPYYLFQCDPVAGAAHFRTGIARGLEIMRHLQRTLGGVAVPRYVADVPGADAKIPLTAGHIVSCGEGCAILRDHGGRLLSYPDG